MPEDVAAAWRRANAGRKARRSDFRPVLPPQFRPHSPDNGQFVDYEIKWRGNSAGKVFK